MTKDKNAIGDILEDIDITQEELGRLKQAFKTDEFKKLFAEYVDEISDPDNRRIYESELTQLEAERGIDITFIHPTPGYVLKTVIDGRHKTFINVASCERIGKPSSVRGRNERGHSGLNWQLPYAQTPVRKDYDRKQALCLVYDVVFHPDTLHMTHRNVPFKQLVTQTALEAVRDAFAVDVDMVNVRFPNIKFKGTPRSTVIRKRSAVQPPGASEPHPLDSIYPSLPGEHKPKPAGGQKSSAKPNADRLPAKPIRENYTTPKYTILHRRHVEYAEMTNELDAKANTTVPHELVVSVMLPLLRNAAEATLDVTSDSLFVISEQPAKYRLRVQLPFAVCEERGHAKFDQALRQLIVTLPVARKALTVQQICCSDELPTESNGPDDLAVNLIEELSGCESDEGHAASPPASEAGLEATAFLDPALLYMCPRYECETDGRTMMFTLHARNIDPNTLAINRDVERCVHVRFQSVGEGYFPQHHAFYVRFAGDLVRSVSDVRTDLWDNALMVETVLDTCGPRLDHFEAGVDAQHAVRIDCDRSADVFRLDALQAALPDGDRPKSPQKLKQRSYSESNCDDFREANGREHSEADDDDDETDDSVGKSKPFVLKASPAKMRTFSECSADDTAATSVGGVGGKCLKGILKRRSSSLLSGSQSSFDESPCSRSVDLNGHPDAIQEEMANCETGKKSVRFDNNIRKLLFRFNSTVAGQRKPKANKRKKKKRNTERRYSEGEASDYDAKPCVADAPAATDGPAKGAGDGPCLESKATRMNKAQAMKHLHDSGVDLRGDHLSTDAVNGDAKCNVEFKSDMIFALDM